MKKKSKSIPLPPPKQNSDVFHLLEEGVGIITDIVKGMDNKNDTSHGLVFSSALNDGQKGVNTKLVVWGSAKDISAMIYTACCKSPELAQMVSNVAINIAVDRIRKTSAKKFTGTEAVLMKANDKPVVVPEQN